MNLNNVTIAGRLTRDPDLKYTPNGVAHVSFTVAVNRPYKNQQTNEYEADFINTVAWRGLAETIANHFKKGDEIGGIGAIRTRSYENQEGKRVFVTEVVMETMSFGQKAQGNGGNGQNYGGNGSPNGNGRGNAQNANTGQNRANQDPFANDGQPIDISDDDLPF
jgi:single-strand DNA-binding protein